MLRRRSLVLEEVLLNPFRLGFYQVLKQMGVGVLLGPARLYFGEEVGRVSLSPSGVLRPFRVGRADVPFLLDELPLLALLATQACGESVVEHAGVLRGKESNRLVSVAALLRGLGAWIEQQSDGWRIRGPVSLRGGCVDSCGDHRVAMMGKVAGLVAREPVRVEGARCAAVSFGDFEAYLKEAVGE